MSIINIFNCVCNDFWYCKYSCLLLAINRRMRCQCMIVSAYLSIMYLWTFRGLKIIFLKSYWCGMSSICWRYHVIVNWLRVYLELSTSHFYVIYQLNNKKITYILSSSFRPCKPLLCFSSVKVCTNRMNLIQKFQIWWLPRVYGSHTLRLKWSSEYRL